MPTLTDRDSVLRRARVDRRSGSAAALFGWLSLLGGVIAGIVVKTGTLGVAIALSGAIVGTWLIAFGGNRQLKAIRALFELDRSSVVVEP